MLTITTKANLLRVRIFARIVLPVILLILPGDFFDDGRSLCLSKLFFNTECPACGLTRACMHLIHFQFEEAYAYNMLCFISFPVMAFCWVMLFKREIRLLKSLHLPPPNGNA